MFSQLIQRFTHRWSEADQRNLEALQEYHTWLSIDKPFVIASARARLETFKRDTDLTGDAYADALGALEKDLEKAEKLVYPGILSGGPDYVIPRIKHLEARKERATMRTVE